ncbi:ATP-grasp domain-containing protein [Thiosocius teredinicola]|uniref:ATP-grasp domain-containing protein n=1 Tax=Thiosocius teredinicola TaxID=1973002 RepID=UPI000F7B18D1
MRVFVFEYVTGGGFAGQKMVAGLTEEGDMMLAAVVRDLTALADVDVMICRDRRLALPPLPLEVHWVDDDWGPIWAACLQRADAVLPIAPETGGILESLCHDVEAAGKLLLNSRPSAVALTASKQRTIEHLGAHGLPVVQSWRAHEFPGVALPTLVVKPDDGVGCKDIHLFGDDRGLYDFLLEQPKPETWLVQPHVPGLSGSLSLLVGDTSVCLLGCNLQRIAQVDDGFLLLGCIINGYEGSRPELLELGKQVCRAIPGLWGYVGIDLIISENGPVILEVNPRLTTSYVGLSQSIGENVAAMLLQLSENPEHLEAIPPQRECVHVDLEMGRVA